MRPAPQGPEPVADPLPYASPCSGTGGFAYFHGSAFPGPCVPHGLVKAEPDTRGAQYGDLRFHHYSGYWAGDDIGAGSATSTCTAPARGLGRVGRPRR